MPKYDDYSLKPSPAPDDQVLILDVHDGSQSSQGSTKVATVGSLGGGPQPDYAPTGLTGATAASRYVGATTAGPPATGTFLLGDFVVDQTGKIWICTAAGSPGSWLPAGTPVPAVVITTIGSTFAPSVTLAPGSTAVVTWTCAGFATQTGLTPSFSFGSAATRSVLMTVTDTAGRNALDQVIVFNIGFNNTNDPEGAYSLPASYNWPSQQVSNVTGITKMTGLQKFLAEQITTWSGTLDFSNLAWLDHIELYQSPPSASLTSVNIEGCSSLVRLDLEQNGLATIDLNAAGSMYDMRAAGQNYPNGTLTFSKLRGPLVNQWHFCIRDQTIVNMPDIDTMLPNVNQLWMWNTRQSGLCKPRSSQLQSFQAHLNSYTSLDLNGQFPPGSNGYVDMHGNLLSSVILTGCNGITNLYLNSNRLNQPSVDGVLAVLDGFGTSGGVVNLTGNTFPSPAGLAHRTALVGRGWTVSVDPSTISVVQTLHVPGGATSGSFVSAVTPGNTVLLIAGSYTTTNGTITSSNPVLGGSAPAGSAKLQEVTSAFNGTTFRGVQIVAWILPNVATASAAVGLTVSGATGATDFWAIEVAGLGTVPAADQAVSSSSITTTAVDSGATLPITSAPEFVLGMAQIAAGAPQQSAGGWTALATSGNGFLGYQIPSSSGGTYDWQQTQFAVSAWAAGVVTLI